MRVTAWGAGLILAAYPALAWGQQAPASPSTTQAQTGKDTGDDYADPADDIVVTGRRRVQPGAVIGDIPPELQLGPADIRSYGVSSIGDLLTELAPETRSGRGSGAPAVLLSGKRISDFREIRDLPTEAILRVDILPEQVALKYGFSADQKVVNIVLRQHFNSVTLEGRDAVATEGGYNAPHGSMGVVKISPTSRFNLNLDYKQTSKLLESERDITGAAVPPPGDGPTPIDDGIDLSRYRTLLPASHDFNANAVYARTILGNVSASLNGSLELSDSTSDLGLPTVAFTLPPDNPFATSPDAATISRYIDSGNPLQQANRSVSSHVGATFNGAVKTWNWSLTGNYDQVDSKTFTDTGYNAAPLQAALDAGNPLVDPFGTLAPPLIEPAASNLAQSTSSIGKIDVLVTGSPFKLPAGPVSTSLHVGVQANDFSSSSLRAGVAQTGDVSRDIVNGRLNLDLPIAGRGVLGPLGTLSANFNVAADHLSDFGTLSTIGYGVNWSPIEAVRALVSFTDQDGAPSAQQLGNPQITTPNSRVFDYVRGETVDVSRISGGNRLLAADTRHVFEAEFNLKPLAKSDLNIIATYTATRTDNEIADLPSPTAAIEAAFPDRFVRDDAGALISVDARPVNFDRENVKEFRWGFNFSQPIKSKLQREFAAYRNGTGADPLAGLRRHRRDSGNTPPPPPPPAGTTGEAPAGTANASPPSGGGLHGGGGHHGGFGGRHGGFGGRGGGQGGGRLQFAVYHTWRLEDQVNIRDGLPVLDLLNGGTNGASGGVPRHEVEAQAGYSNNGIGARLSVNWQSGTRVVGGTADTPDTLNFSSLATLNLRLFADLGAQLGFAAKHPWARGMRVTLSANNLLDSRQRVTDATGETPISYQPDYLDPLGRTVMLSVRKLFFQRSAR